jgi:glutaredoxin
MKKSVMIFFLLWSSVVLFLGDVALAALFRWVDDKGVVHIADNAPVNQKNISPLSIEKDEAIPENNKSDSPGVRGPGSNSDKAVKETQPPQVELFTTSWCPYCKQARNFFQSRGIPFTEYDIEKDPKAALRKRQLDNKEGVPLAIINGQPVHGYSELAYKKALGEKP